LTKNLISLAGFNTIYCRFCSGLLLARVTFSRLLGIRECAICGALATHECKNCFREFGDGLDKISFCDVCL